MMRHERTIILLTLVLLSTASLHTQSKTPPGKQAPVKGFRGEFLWLLKDAEEKFFALAQAFPEELYGWRPMNGVRSPSEVFVHVAVSSYTIPAAAGVKSPLGNVRDLEKTMTAKAKVIEFLKNSFAHLRKAVVALRDQDLNKSAKVITEETTVRGVFFLTATHMHEHLGQLIAYARENHIVPPWSALEENRGQKSR
jgi:uncharacterized damage-inducible protein DinB